MYSDGGDSTAVVAISDGCELIMCSKHGRRSAGGQGNMSPLPVSYTHLTLPTIYSV